jgi:hypothetical protein
VDDAVVRLRLDREAAALAGELVERRLRALADVMGRSAILCA